MTARVKRPQYQFQHHVPVPTIDEIGHTYGQYTVIAAAPSNGNGARWLCRCSCGEEKAILGTELRSGKRRSCKACADRKSKAPAPVRRRRAIKLKRPNHWGRRSYYRPSTTRPRLSEHQIEVAISLSRQGFPLPHIAKIIGRTEMAVSLVVRGKTKRSAQVLKRKNLMRNILRLAGRRSAPPTPPPRKQTLGELLGRIAA